MKWAIVLVLLAYAYALDLECVPSNTDLLKIIQRLNSTVVQLENRLSQQSSPVIGFFAQLGGKDVSLGLNEVLIFNDVHTNIGNGYDVQHGHFTAPVNGLYHFTVTVMNTRSASTVFVRIVKNGARVDTVWASGSEFTSTTKSVVISLNKGDMIWVRQPNAPTFVGEIIHSLHSSFTGHLLSII